MPQLGDPVEGNPFDQGPRLGTPVEGNPFAKLGPAVEGDPFAAKPTPDQGSLNPLTNVGEALKGGVSQVKEGLGQLDPFSTDRGKGPISDTLQTGKGLGNIALGALGAITSPVTGVAQTAANLYGRIPGGLTRPEDFMTALWAGGPKGGMKPIAKPLEAGAGPEAAKIGAPEKPVDGQVAPPELPPYQAPPQKPPAGSAAPARAIPPEIKGQAKDFMRWRGEQGAASQGAGSRAAPQALGAATPRYPDLHALGQEPGKALIQQQLGLADREATQAVTRLEPYQAQFNRLPRTDRLSTIGYMENRGKGATISPELKPAADAMRSVYKDIEYKWGEMKPDMSFIEDYFRHQVKQPKELNKFFSAWKEGSAKGAGQKRTFPTVSDLLDAGHELVNDNPVETTMDYAWHMGRYLGAEKAFQLAREDGAVKYYDPKNAPEGWVPLVGRHGQPNQYGQVPHAPPEFAKPWNAFAGQGFARGDMIQNARQIMNTMTAVKLLSGYHVFTMGTASFNSELARAFTNLGARRPLTAGKALGSAATILKPILGDVARGWRGQRIYSGEGTHGAPRREAMSRFLAREQPEESKIIDYLAQANMRPNKMDRSMSMSMQGNLYTAFKRGALSGQLNQYKSMIGDAPGVWKATATAKAVMDLVGRSMQTIMAPLFEKFIPQLKLGRAMQEMGDWLHNNPDASFENIMQQARSTQRNMDDRFGEMVQDNLFWNQKLKEGLQVAALSYSWNVGIGRAMGGAVKDIGSAKFTSRAAYAIAFPLGAMYLGAVYQALKGQGTPQSFADLLAPKTGGTNPATKFRQETPERALMPGHMKDAFELKEVATGDRSILEIATNKLNPALRLLGNLATGKDWRGDPIADPEAALGSRIMQHLEFAGKETLPIPVGTAMQQSATSGFNMFETVMGVRRAPDFLQDPTGHGDTMRALSTKGWVAKLRHDEAQAIRVGDHEKAGIIQQEIRRRSPKPVHKVRVQ